MGAVLDNATAVRTPVILVTGYLGAGKTTLLREIISRASGRRIAVVMNEFGKIAIDSKIIEAQNIRVAEIAGGCVCCSMSGEFAAAIEELVLLVKPDWIVVETTGLAEPAELASDIADSMPRVYLHSVLTVVDADALAKSPSIGHTGMEQIEIADRILLNKKDLVDGMTLDSIEAGLRKINPEARIIKTTNCSLGSDIGRIFGAGSRNQEEQDDPGSREKADTHGHDAEYFDFTTVRPLDHDGFMKFLGSLPEEVYRAKGFVRSERGGFLMNYVGGRHTLEIAACQKTELVFLGAGIQKHERAIRDRLGKLEI